MSTLVDSYLSFMQRNSDPRTLDWLLAGSPVPLLTILVSYLYFCTSAGPRYMKDRKPYDLTNVLIGYNVVQVILSVYLLYEGLAAGWWNDYSFSCQPVDYSNDPKSLRMAAAVWAYLMCKVIELLDTVFFIMRKKYNQVSFLHLYHHTMMPVCAWVGVTFLPGGHGTLLGVINAFIHIIMYAYYLLAAMGPHMQKYLWWKKHLTGLQMVQFIIVGFHNAQVFFNGCNYPKTIAALLTGNAFFFLYLFGNFYYKMYVKNTRRKDAEEAQKGVQNGKLKST